MSWFFMRFEEFNKFSSKLKEEFNFYRERSIMHANDCFKTLVALLFFMMFSFMTIFTMLSLSIQLMAPVEVKQAALFFEIGEIAKEAAEKFPTFLLLGVFFLTVLFTISFVKGMLCMIKIKNLRKRKDKKVKK